MSFFKQLSNVGSVITALVLRETKTRFGKTHLGFFWAIFEPVAYVMIFLAIRSAVKDSAAFGESIVLFMATGILMFRVFTSIAGNLMGAITSNRALLAYPPVKPNDVIFARFVLEILIMYFVIALFFLILPLTVEFRVIVDYQNFFAAIGAVSLLGIGVGTFNAVLSVLMPSWSRIWGLIRLPLFIMSGIFYLPSAMPSTMQDVLWWNPVIHCVEWLRVGTYLTYDPLLTPSYVLSVGVGFFLAGLLLERIYRFRLLSA